MLERFDIRVIHPDHRAVLKRAGIVIVSSLLALRSASGAPPGGASTAATESSASTTRMAVAPFGPNTLRRELRSRLEAAAAAGLVATGAAVTPRADVLRAAGSAAVPCTDATCWDHLYQVTKTPLWLRGTCAVEGSTYRIHLDLYDAGAKVATVARDDTCEICTETELLETVNVAASALHRAWKQGPKPQAPTALAVAAARRPSATSATAATTNATPLAGVADDRPMPRAADGAAASSARPPWRKVLTLVAVAGATVAVGLGITFAVLDSDYAGFNSVTGRNKFYDTRDWAIESFSVAGVLLLGAGIAWFAPWSSATSAPSVTYDGHGDSTTLRQARHTSTVNLGFTVGGFQLRGAF